MKKLFTQFAGLLFKAILFTPVKRLIGFTRAVETVRQNIQENTILK